jgi:hypothetical protein
MSIFNTRQQALSNTGLFGELLLAQLEEFSTLFDPFTQRHNLQPPLE